MVRITGFARLPAVLIVGLWLGCADDRAAGPSPAGRREDVPQISAERERLTQLAQRVARALADPAVRAEVYQAIQGSPYREQKLHFRTLLTGGGPRLAAAVAGVLPGLDSIPDLEFYLPVDEHSNRWKGEDRLLVAAALRDHETPVAFGLDGRPVSLSADQPPDIPTLALVPAETDFSQVPQVETCPDCEPPPDGGDPGIPDNDGAVSAHLAMLSSYVSGKYEGWLMGDPEYEVHAIGHRSGSDTTVADLQCAGREAASSSGQPGVRDQAYVYDQNGASWSGQVRLLSYDQIRVAQSNPDSAIVLWLWEDDAFPCAIKRDSREVNSYLSRVGNVIWTHRNAIRPIIRRDWKEIRPDSLFRLIRDIFNALNNDDIVGIIVDQRELGLYFSDATHVIVHVKDDDTREVRGRVRLALVQ
jgi:hypothetical protein